LTTGEANNKYQKNAGLKQRGTGALAAREATMFFLTEFFVCIKSVISFENQYSKYETKVFEAKHDLKLNYF